MTSHVLSTLPQLIPGSRIEMEVKIYSAALICTLLALHAAWRSSVLMGAVLTKKRGRRYRQDVVLAFLPLVLALIWNVPREPQYLIPLSSPPLLLVVLLLRHRTRLEHLKSLLERVSLGLPKRVLYSPPNAQI